MRSSLVPFAVAAILSAAGATTAAAQEEFRFHSFAVEARPEAKLIREWVDEANEILDGETIRLFPGGALGISEPDMLRILPGGRTIQFAAVWPGYLGRDLPQLAYTLPAGLVRDPAKTPELYALMREIYQSFYDKFELKLLGFVHPDTRAVGIQCKTPVHTLEELESKKVRVWEKLHAEAFSELGVAAQVIPQSEMYVALQTGVVDCATYTTRSALTISLQEVAPYWANLFQYITHPIGIVVAQSSWDSLSTEEQEGLQQAADRIDAKSLSVFMGNEIQAQANAEYEAAGGKIIEPFSEADQEKFSSALRQVWEEANVAAGDVAAANQKKISDLLSQ